MMRMKKLFCRIVATVTVAALVVGYGSILDTTATTLEADAEEAGIVAEDVSVADKEATEKETTAEATTEYQEEVTEAESEEDTKSASLTATSDYTYEILDDGTAEITDYSGADSELVIPDTIDGYTVTSIGKWAFEYCENLTSVEIPNSITNIGAGAFTLCYNLVDIIIPDSVSTIEYAAFQCCESMTNIKLPNKITSIEWNTFYGCINLTTVEIPDSVTSIGYNVFYGCENLTHVDISANVSSISSNAFSGCTGLTSITVDENNKNYLSEDGVLYNIDKTEIKCCPAGKTGDFEIPSTVTSIGNAAFYNCSGLTSIKMSDNVTSIKGEAFYNCKGLTSIDLSDNLTTIGNEAFIYCYNLVSIDIPKSVTNIGNYAFFCCENLISIEIPNGITSINEGMFMACESLKTVIIPNSVNDIEYNAFFECTGLTSVMLPDSVTSIERCAFGGCNSLNAIYYTGTQTQWKSITFEEEWNIDCPEDMEIHYNYTGKQTLTASAASSTITGVGNTTTITASTDGDGAITYSSSNTSVATVDSTGKVTAKGYGTATITVEAAATELFSAATKTITINVKLAKPTLKSATNTTSGVKVTWGAVTGATKYQVYRKTSGGTWTKLGTSASTSYTDKTAKSGITYYYSVCCMNSSGTYTSDYNTSGISKKYLSKGKISSLTNKSGGITIKWSKVTGASGYYIYRKTSSGSYSKIKTITSGSTLSYTDTKVKSKNGTTYVYKVVPYSGSTTGSFTAKTTVRLTGTTLSSVKNSSSKKMTVKWSKKSSITGYQIQYSTSSSFSSYKTVTVSGASKVSKVISSLTKNKTYYVRIRTYKTVNGTKYYSAWSSKKSVKIKK